ncbi:MAG: serine/threonine-protein kinase [Cyanobacteria bacterium J06650_10]
MQSPIPIGTLLQNHYRVVQLLGQGGFGRTYLAEDQGRFNERCAIKEFVPIKGEDHFSDKATQLFQREASVLYQISHPQIPKFRATFEEGERLFLVQDYVDGPTFHEVLNQRRQQGRTFSEGEVKQFLKQILPVLAHIHAKGIIHRDISPDNIILRQQDQLPVLIDFGVVKEVVTRMQLEGAPSPATTVGKAGYAPSEQMQTGRAYPSSDLYALAVTAVVLLSGKEPQVLFDDVNFAWRWQEVVSVGPAFAQVLNKALNFKPGDRFASVSDMAKALSASELKNDLTNAAVSATPPANKPAGVAPPASQMRTVAVGRANPDVNRAASQPHNQTNTQINRQTTAKQNRNTRMVMPSEQDRPSLLENPFAVGGLAAGLAAVAGFGGWAVVQGLGPPPGPTPTITSLPPLTSDAPTPAPTPTQVSPKPVEYQQPQLQLTPSVTKVLEGNVRGGDTVNYPLVAEAGQSLSVSLEQESMLLSVLKSDGRPVRRNAERVRSWEGELEETGEYQVQLKPVSGVSSSDYRLEVTLGEPPAPEAPAPDPIETAEPDPIETSAPAEGSGDNSAGENDEENGEGTVPPETSPDDNSIPDEPVQLDIQSQRVSFPSGSSSINVANNVARGQVKRYIVNAQEGQILTVRVINSDAPVSFDLLLPSGDLLADAANLQTWQGFLPQGGDYSIDVVSEQLAEFTLEIGATASVPSE